MNYRQAPTLPKQLEVKRRFVTHQHHVDAALLRFERTRYCNLGRKITAHRVQRDGQLRVFSSSHLKVSSSRSAQSKLEL